MCLISSLRIKHTSRMQDRMFTCVSDPISLQQKRFLLNCCLPFPPSLLKQLFHLFLCLGIQLACFAKKYINYITLTSSDACIVFSMQHSGWVTYLPLNWSLLILKMNTIDILHNAQKNLKYSGHVVFCISKILGRMSDHLYLLYNNVLPPMKGSHLFA